MWFIPLLVIGAIVIAASRSPREADPPRLALAAGGAPVPGPISVLGDYVRVGHFPPPTVILCAIAEAEAIGRDDLASEIVRLFVAPVVHAHELAIVQQMAPPASVPIYAPAPYAFSAPVPAPMPTPMPVARSRGGVAAARSPRAAAFPQSAPPLALGSGRSSTDAEIRAMLATEPERFFAMVTRTAPPVEMPRAMSREFDRREVAVVPIPAAPIAPPITEAVAQLQEAGFHEDAAQTHALAPSPIHGVSDEAWREFVLRLEREQPTFSSSRHVGQYRQCRDRLVELDIDPASILGSAQAQRAALDVDLGDAHHHAIEGGLLDDHVGRTVTVPGRDEPETITLSGVLGVIQCAGLDNATNWLERPSDRKRYPHTTRAFLRTNGMF